MTAKEKTLVVVVGAGLITMIASASTLWFKRKSLTDDKKKNLKNAVVVGLIVTSGALFASAYLKSK